jgi:cytosine/adenosine deaminase-related metal-dependent hydrolase
MQTFLRARVVVPVTRPPIEDGAVVVGDGRILAVGRWRDLKRFARQAPVDLGAAALLPGLVNAHCHLDYTDMAGKLGPQRSFPDWIKGILALKAEWGYSEYAASWLHGARMLVRTGTTTVGDIEAVPELLPEVWEATALRVLSFLEITGVRCRQAPEAILQATLDKAESFLPGRCRAWLSPHAPYSTTPGLLRRAAEESRARGWRFAMHVAESVDEYEMFLHGRGPMFDWLERNQRDMADCGRGSPIQQLAGLGILGGDLVAAHANCLASGDAQRLARAEVSVVHCPRSHAYFGHRPFQWRDLARYGVNLCLGTDSLVTTARTPGETPLLSLFAEMRAFALRAAGQRPETILRMATVNGAKALGLEGRVGELTEEALADLIAVPCAAAPPEVYEALVHYSGETTATMIEGRWAIPPQA